MDARLTAEQLAALRFAVPVLERKVAGQARHTAEQTVRRRADRHPERDIHGEVFDLALQADAHLEQLRDLAEVSRDPAANEQLELADGWSQAEITLRARGDVRRADQALTRFTRERAALDAQQRGLVDQARAETLADAG